jgi:hypothetical protein
LANRFPRHADSSLFLAGYSLGLHLPADERPDHHEGPAEAADPSDGLSSPPPPAEPVQGCFVFEATEPPE